MNIVSESAWIGGIFLKEEGGYDIILKSLAHYKKRLMTLGQSPELQNTAAMFASVLNQEAKKIVPEIEKTKEKICHILSGVEKPKSLQEDMPLLEKALACYQSDIQKAQDTGNEYFLRLVGDLPAAQNRLEQISTAKVRLNQSDYD